MKKSTLSILILSSFLLLIGCGNDDSNSGTNTPSSLEADQVRACKETVSDTDQSECIKIVEGSKITAEEIKACEEANWTSLPILECIKDVKALKGT